jgi:hypothetical protein
MCLHSKGIKTYIKRGYKLGFVYSRGNFEAFYEGPMPGVWVRDSRLEVSSIDKVGSSDPSLTFYEKNLTSGFHIITSKKAAKLYLKDLQTRYGDEYKDWQVFGCSYTGTLASGFENSDALQGKIPCVIAACICIDVNPLE